MTRYALVVVLVILTGYGLIEGWPLIAGPSLSVISPEDGASVPGGILTVNGRAARAALLTLNGGILVRDKDGHFSETLTFPRGGSILTFVATDRFGRHVTVTRNVFVPF